MKKTLSKIVTDGNICRISLIGGGVAIIDKCMEDHVKSSVWHSVESIFGRSAARFVTSVNGSLSADFLQNVICEAHGLRKIYALDGDLMNCRVENLTPRKPRENANVAALAVPKSGIDGIEWVAKTGKWGVYFAVGPKLNLMASYDAIGDAMRHLADLQAFHRRKS